jgi:hypothetical protein
VKPVSAPEPWRPSLDAARATGALDQARPGGGEFRRHLMMRYLRALECLGYDLTELPAANSGRSQIVRDTGLLPMLTGSHGHSPKGRRRGPSQTVAVVSAPT